MNAAVGRVQLTKLAGWNDIRRRNATVLHAGIEAVVAPRVADGAVHVYHQFTVRSPHRDALRERLVNRGIGCGIYYRVPIHRLPSYGLTLELPETDKAAAEVLSLPVHPSLSDADLQRIIAGVNA